MEMEEKMARVYAVVDDQGRIVQVEGEYSLENLQDMEKAVLLEEGTPCDQLNHAQNLYLEGGLFTGDGIPRYKLVQGQAVLRSQAELEADRAALPVPEATAAERLEAQVTYTAMMTDTLLEEA